MLHSLVPLTALIASASAFPTIANFAKRQTIDETNAGFFPNLVFDPADQYVDVSAGSLNEWVAPAAGDIRGPCPGLNAAANHNFIHHSGVIDLQDTTQGLQNAYNFGVSFAAPLFFFATLNSGSIIDEKWSIGGPMPTTTLGVLGQGLGISNSHNKYEGDASPGRGDAYLHNGDSHSLNLPNYEKMLAHFNYDGLIDFPGIRAHALETHEYTIQNNPYGFFGPTFAVPPIAHHFILAMMSNHSEDNIGGYLNKNILNSFFSVTQDSSGNLNWNPGQERIPNNWYRRPSSNPYGVVASAGDFGILLEQYPVIGDVGGNTGTPNSFTGVDVADLTGGVYQSSSLAKGNNAMCFFMQAAVFVIPGAAAALAAAATPFIQQANQAISGTNTQLGCAQLSSMSMAPLQQFPGYTWQQPLQPATPY